MLDTLKTLKEEIQIGIIGAGVMGRGLLYQSVITPGIKCAAIADIKIAKAIACVESVGLLYKIVHNINDMHRAMKQGKIAVCDDGELLARSELIAVLVEASGSVREAGYFSETALDHNKHLVLMNSEADLTFGPYLMRFAEKNGLGYTSCGGDQHTVIKHMVDEIKLWGLELVMAGNIKGFINRYADPTSIMLEADKRGLNHNMCTAMTDGTKLNIEMALLCNALKLSPIVPGMKGPRIDRVDEVFSQFDFQSLWQDKRGVVDYILGAEPSGGVFVVGYCDNEYQKKMLKYYKMGKGPFYLFYRPYHLCHIEAMRTIAEVFINKRSILKPDAGYRTNVYAYAKRDLQKGERLDGVGGYSCYGLIENSSVSKGDFGLPICLAENISLKRNLKRDERISFQDLNYDPDSDNFKIYMMAHEGKKAKA